MYFCCACLNVKLEADKFRIFLKEKNNFID
jgi:hypothetical protein